MALLSLLFACGITNENAGESLGGNSEKSKRSNTESDEVVDIDSEYHFNIANVLAEEDVTSYGIEKFAELANEKSGGKIQFEILHGGQLGSGVETFEAVKNGNLDFAADSYANLASLTQAFEMFHLPFLFESRDQLLNVLSSEKVKERIDEDLSDIGLKWFSSYEIGGPRVIGTSKKKLETLEDFKGLKFRASRSPLEIASQEAWGAKGVTVDWPETPESVRLGMVDGLTVPYASFYSAKLHEGGLVNYILDLSFQNYFSVMVMNQEKWDGLPEEVQNVLIEAEEEAREWHVEFVSDYVTENIEEMVEEGLEIYSMSDKEYEKIKEVTKDEVWDEFVGQEGMPEDKLELILNELGPVGDGDWGYEIPN